MKKNIKFQFFLIALALVIVAGCKKSNDQNQTWSWKGTTYTSAACTAGTGASNGTLNVVSSSPVGSLQVYFYNGLPTTSGMDTVVAWGTATAETQVSISLGAGANSYQSTGGNGANQMVMVTVSGGKVAVATMNNSPVELINVASNTTDSSGVTFSISQ
jgi:hypothetical protein